MRKPQEADVQYGFEMPNPLAFSVFAAGVGPAPGRKWVSNGGDGNAHALHEVLFDAAIAGGSATFGLWAATGHVLPEAGIIAFGLAFFMSLGISRRRAK